MSELYFTTGQVRKAEEFLVAHEKSIDSNILNLYKERLAFLNSNYEDAVQITLLLTEDAISYQEFFYTKHLQLGLIFHTISDNALAAKHFNAERDFLIEKIKESENDQLIKVVAGSKDAL